MTFCYTCQITKTISAVSILPEFIVIFKINVVLVQCPIPYLSKFNHNHKKQMCLETQAELAVLRIYVANQAILQPVLLYRASKYKQTKVQGSEDCLWTHIFTFL